MKNILKILLFFLTLGLFYQCSTYYPVTEYKNKKNGTIMEKLQIDRFKNYGPKKNKKEYVFSSLSKGWFSNKRDSVIKDFYFGYYRKDTLKGVKIYISGDKQGGYRKRVEYDSLPIRSISVFYPSGKMKAKLKAYIGLYYVAGDSSVHRANWSTHTFGVDTTYIYDEKGNIERTIDYVTGYDFDYKKLRQFFKKQRAIDIEEKATDVKKWNVSRAKTIYNNPEKNAYKNYADSTAVWIVEFGPGKFTVLHGNSGKIICEEEYPVIQRGD